MKERIYLDTSVIGYLRAENSPREMRITNRFWEILKRGKCDVYISDVTERELAACPQPKRAELLALLDEIAYTVIITEDDEHVIKIYGDIVRHNLLSEKEENDRYHIAAAIQRRCRYILSWNFRHIANEESRRKVHAIAALEGLNKILICTPEMFIERRRRKHG